MLGQTDQQHRLQTQQPNIYASTLVNGKLHSKDRKFRWRGAKQAELSGRKQRPSTNDCRWSLGPVQTRFPARVGVKRVQPLSSNGIISLSTQRQDTFAKNTA